MLHAAERYSSSALQRAFLRVAEAAITEGVELTDLPDDFPTDLSDVDGEPLTLGCLIEDLHHEAGVTDDDGETIVRDEVPAEMYVSRQDAIAAWRIDKRVEDGDETVTEEELSFADDIRRRKAAYRKFKSEQAKSASSETDLQAQVRKLREQGFRVEAPAATAEREEDAEEEAEEAEEAEAAPVKRLSPAEAIRERMKKAGLRRKAEDSPEPVKEAEAEAKSA